MQPEGKVQAPMPEQAAESNMAATGEARRARRAVVNYIVVVVKM